MLDLARGKGRGAVILDRRVWRYEQWYPFCWETQASIEKGENHIAKDAVREYDPKETIVVIVLKYFPERKELPYVDTVYISHGLI